MLEPYAIRTEPHFQDYLWGGRNLSSKLGKKLPAEGVWAESWEIIDHPHHQSLITNGELAGKTLSEVTAENPSWLLGEHERLPLLLKYLDCQKVLSVQVHPDDSYALKMSPPDLGKTEAWYVVAAEPGAKLYAGLKAGVTANQLAQAMDSGTVDECLHSLEPSVGDCVFIPAGTVHALGAGLLIAEIQQASNTTFRLFDWNRVGADGQPRPLHLEQALEVTDFQSGPRVAQKPETLSSTRERLVSCDKFTLDRFLGSDEVGGDGKFHLLTSPHGTVKLEGENESLSLELGQSVILPAASGRYRISCQPDCGLLDMFVG